MVTTTLFYSFLAAWTVSSLPISKNFVSRRTVPDGFIYDGPAPEGETLTLLMALRPGNDEGLESLLYNISTPSSPSYGQWLTKDQVNSYMAPSTQTKGVVDNWTKINNLETSSFSPAGDWLNFTINVAKANELFSANFSVFTDSTTGNKTIRTLSYSIPTILQDHVEIIHPTIVFPVHITQPPIVSLPMPPTTNGTPNCTGIVTPNCIQELYHLPPSADPQGANFTPIAVSSYGSQFARKKDLHTFLRKFRPDLPPQLNFTVIKIDDGHNPQSDLNQTGISEGNVDIQYTAGLAGGIPTPFISIGQHNHDGLSGFLDVINFLLDMENPPQIFTTSYGFDEFQVYDAQLLIRLCKAHMQLSARGVTVLFSSGDQGVAGSVNGQTCKSFLPSFPATCPFVTSVGGTAGINPEVAANLSSGGFSNIFSRPSYQSSSVNSYLNAIGKTNSELFNSSGRGYPDISAQGYNLPVISGDKEMMAMGTSFSTPIVASVVALLNAELIAAGRPVAGFINPFIYANPDVFNDITSGSNPGCGTEGFPAKKGWDAVTGLGTPDYTKLRAAFGL
ncbi:hypothetical protein M422DRAFT_24097 [Sphaerobolus stellatus SS14]|nr:hypothetical protein M422DRAFT_24097 [Sphaerobolus stellatus SS14]